MGVSHKCRLCRTLNAQLALVLYHVFVCRRIPWRIALAQGRPKWNTARIFHQPPPASQTAVQFKARLHHSPIVLSMYPSVPQVGGDHAEQHHHAPGHVAGGHLLADEICANGGMCCALHLHAPFMDLYHKHVLRASPCSKCIKMNENQRGCGYKCADWCLPYIEQEISLCCQPSHLSTASL